MKKTKLTRTLMAACSVVALSAMVYGCSSGPSQSEYDAAKAEAEANAAAAAEAQAAAEAAQAAAAAAEAARMAAEAAQAEAEAKAAADVAAAEAAAAAAAAAAEAAEAAAAAQAAEDAAARDAAVAAAAAAAEQAAAAATEAAEAKAAAEQAAADLAAAEKARMEAEAAAEAAKMAQEEAEKKAGEESQRADDLQQMDDDAAAAAAVASAGALYKGLGKYFTAPVGSSHDRDIATDSDGDGTVDDDDDYGGSGLAPKTGIIALDATTGLPSLGRLELTETEGGGLMLGSWTGATYTGKSLSGQTPMEYEAHVYTTQGAEGGTPFFHLYGSGTEDTSGYLGFIETPDTTFTGMGANVRGFPTAGVTSYNVLGEQRGTYDGAPGTYRCVDTAGCTAVTMADGGFDLASADATNADSLEWRFYPDAGAEVPRPDGAYQAFGWWLSKNTSPDQDDAMAYVIQGRRGSLGAASFDGTVAGKATYSGHAVGKYAIYSALLNQGDAGHFTADAMLTANFGTAAAISDGTDFVTVTGLIDGFMTEDGEKPWTVALGDGMFPATDTASSGSFSGTTTWRIEGVASTGTGEYMGMFHNNPTPSGAAQTAAAYVPDEVGGTFDAQFESATGRLIGAFAATRD